MAQDVGLEEKAADKTSQAFLGQWERLVSTTNWEKGRIIHEWRVALRAAGASPQQYSDEAWSQRVGNVSSQHVGRLRRVHELFEADREKYPGLYWSHFQAALDWDDAPLWLQGASEEGRSVSEMRRHRVETLGEVAADADEAPSTATELDDDSTIENASQLSETLPPSDALDAEFDDAAEDSDESNTGTDFDADAELNEDAEPAPIIRPFESLAELPNDVSEAFESFKLAILHHKLAGWTEISQADLLGALAALRELALTPTTA